MRKALRWLGIGLGTLVGLILIAVVAIFALSEWALREHHEAKAETLAGATPALLADAPRQAKILGCVSCHGEGLKGKVMFDVPNVAKVYAPNLTQIAARASDQQLAAAIRQGVGHDGRGLFVMPSPMYSRLSDGEVAALIAWIRSVPATPETKAETIHARPIGRFALALGRLRPAPAKIEEFRTQVPIDLGPATAPGRILAGKNCSECHGPALFGGAMESGAEVPDLAIAAGYDLAQFTRLLRTGETPSGKELGLMKEVAVNDFSHFTDAEIAALHAYLQARAKKLGG